MNKEIYINAALKLYNRHKKRAIKLLNHVVRPLHISHICALVFKFNLKTYSSFGYSQILSDDRLKHISVKDILPHYKLIDRSICQGERKNDINTEVCLVMFFQSVINDNLRMNLLFKFDRETSKMKDIVLCEYITDINNKKVQTSFHNGVGLNLFSDRKSAMKLLKVFREEFGDFTQSQIDNNKNLNGFNLNDGMSEVKINRLYTSEESMNYIYREPK